MMEEAAVATDESVDVDYDSFDEQIYDRPAERWAPLGAAASSPIPSSATEARYIILQILSSFSAVTGKRSCVCKSILDLTIS